MNTALYSMSAEVFSSHLLLISAFVLAFTFVLVPSGGWTEQLSYANFSSA